MIIKQYKQVSQLEKNCDLNDEISDIEKPKPEYSQQEQNLISSNDVSNIKLLCDDKSLKKSENNKIENKESNSIENQSKKKKLKNKKSKKIVKNALEVNVEYEVESCLKMNKLYFNCDNEINSKFGTKILKYDKKSNNKNLSYKNRYLNMRHYFTKGDPQWPHLNREECGMKMNFIEEKNEFSISFDIEYLKKKEIFDLLANSMLLEDITIFMNNNPFFFQGLIKLAEINMIRNESEEAFKYLQKALYVFESSLHPLFSPFSYLNKLPKTALNPSDVESREIFVLLGYYMNYLGFRGLFCTALQYCILLLSMDIQNDHFHSLLHIDYYSIQSSSFDTLININNLFLTQFSNYCTWDSQQIDGYTDRNYPINDQNDITLYHILPNFAFGVPLTMYTKYIQLDSSEKEQFKERIFEKIKNIDINQIIKKKFCSEDVFDCSIYLIQSLLLFPEFVLFLTRKSKIDVPNTIKKNFLPWEEILSFFSSLDNKNLEISSKKEEIQYPYLLMGKLLVEAYVEKCGNIWRTQINFEWLHMCCTFLYELISDKINSKILDEFIIQRRQILMQSKFNVFRYLDVSISEFSNNNLILPKFFRNEDYIKINPSTNGSIPFSLLSLNSDPIVLFFQSLLPWSIVNELNNNTVPINLKELIVNSFTSFKNYIKKNFLSKL